MIRLLTLLIVLFGLTAIAFKGPDQTALEAVREAGSKAADTISGLTDAAKNTTADPQFRVLTDEAKKAIQRSQEMRGRLAKNLPSRAGTDPSGDTSEKTFSAPAETPSEQPELGERDAQSGERKARGRDAWVITGDDGPRLPAVPVPPVKQMKLPDFAPGTAKDPGIVTRETAGIGGIGVLYESADKLLDEIR